MNGCPVHISCSVRAAGPRSRHLVVAGEVDLASAPTMRRFLSSQLDGLPPGGEMVVDMSEVCFLSAAGLRELVAVARSGRERRVAVRLDPVSDLVDRLLEISRVWREVERGPGDVDVVGPGAGSRGRMDPTVGWRLAPGYPPAMGEHEDADRRSGEQDDPGARAAAARERSLRLAAQVAELAGGVAQTEDRVADQLDRIAADTTVADRAGRLREQADQARSFARHERAEQRRWEGVAGSDRR